MEKIIVIFGGQSVEHDISIITGIQALRSIKGEYEVLPIYINRKGEWLSADNMDDVHIYSDFEKLAKRKKQVKLLMGKGCVEVYAKITKRIFKPSCALVCLHGSNGEDGAIAGLFEMCAIAYTCPKILSSALCMDKAFAKTILKSNGIKVADFVVGSEEKSLLLAEKKLGYPIIVKPARGGSSIGIKVCQNFKDLKEAFEIAQNYDKKVIFEHFIENGREFNCACLSFSDREIISNVSEVDKSSFYTFDEKYVQEKMSRPIKVPRALSEKIKKLTKQTCEILECEGVVRVDFLMDGEEILVNELNTVPGSFAFYLFSSMKEVIVEMIEQAKLRFQQKSSLSHVYSSPALQVFAKAVEMHKNSK